MKFIKYVFLIAFTLLSSCATLKSWVSPIASYDQKTYESLTTLKATTNQMIEDCVPDISQEKVNQYILSIDIIYEYELGKGSANAEVQQQLQLFRDRMLSFLSEAKLKVLSTIYKESKKETLGRILDVIIATEFQKPR